MLKLLQYIKNKIKLFQQLCQQLLQYIRKKIEKLFYNKDQFTEEKPSIIEAVMEGNKLYVINHKASEIYGVTIYEHIADYSHYHDKYTYPPENPPNCKRYLTLAIYTPEEKLLLTKDTKLPQSLLKHQSIFKPSESLRSELKLPAYILDCTKHFIPEIFHVLSGGTSCVCKPKTNLSNALQSAEEYIIWERVKLFIDRKRELFSDAELALLYPPIKKQSITRENEREQPEQIVTS